nr:MAG TPA: hypothetical protein [Caudoviricetes sp.]
MAIDIQKIKDAIASDKKALILSCKIRAAK